MAELAVIMSMITVTSTAASILGLIKRRCGASQAVSELVRKCTELVDKINELLKTLEGSTQVPHDTRGISTALNLRKREFEEVLQELEKMNRRTKLTPPIVRTVRFIMAQGIAKKMETIHDSLVHLRGSIETIVSNWQVAQFVVTKVEEIVTIDVTKKNELGRWKLDAESWRIESGSVNYVDRIQITMVKLTDANKAALNQYGALDRLSVPDGLYESSLSGYLSDDTCKIQLMQRSAELLHPEANHIMGINYQRGYGVEKNLELALAHFQVASSLQHLHSTSQLMKHYHRKNDRRRVVKYVEMASRMPMQWLHWIRCVQCAVEYNFESIAQLFPPLNDSNKSTSGLQQSICHFFGLSVPRCSQKAVEALQKLDSSSYYAVVMTYNSNRFYIHKHFRWENRKSSSLHEYLNFLFSTNQFVPFLTLSYEAEIYSQEEWNHHALHAASCHCVDAHVFLANHYLLSSPSNKSETERHLRIAAEAGHIDAQYLYSRLFGK